MTLGWSVTNETSTHTPFSKLRNHPRREDSNIVESRDLEDQRKRMSSRHDRTTSKAAVEPAQDLKRSKQSTSQHRMGRGV